MAKGEEEAITDKLIWGTWEELLLVSAVKRHGTKNWDSVAMEIQNRITSSSSSSHLLCTPHNCKHKYHDLRRRFMSDIDDINNNESDDTESMNPWLDELRKLRVAELRRQVQQYDVSIVSLQLKVKRLREERERSSDEVKPVPDLEMGKEDNEPVLEKPISGNDSDRENQSFNESNSTDPKDVNDADESDKKLKPNDTTVAGDGVSDPVTSVSPEDNKTPAAAAGGEGSYNGSSETIAKDSAQKSSEPIPKREPGESPELWESVAESKGDGGVEGSTMESSDVQSSASLSKENRRKKDVSISSSGEEPETDEISPAIKRVSVKSHPLGKVLEMIKSHKYGYVFERRLDSQETSKYKSLIRQHMDLEMVNKRMKAGKYSGSRSKFFRDLLLLVNNAIVFFPDNSSEFKAAIELRQLVSKEMGSRNRKTTKSSETQPPLPPPLTTAPPPKSDPDLPPSLLVKPKTTLPIIACRKRSSISKGDKKTEKKEAVNGEEKKSSLLDRKQDIGVASLLEDQIVIKKGKRDRPGSGPRSSRTGKSPSNMNSNKPSPSGEDDNSEKTEKEKEKQSIVNTVAKKRSVANFLNRMKSPPPPSSSSNGTLLDSLKNSGVTPSNSKGNNTEQKKGNGGKGNGSKQSSSKKNTNSSPAKRSVGRPPKRNATSPITPPTPAKRSRDTNETEAAATKQPRKRAKRCADIRLCGGSN